MRLDRSMWSFPLDAFRDLESGSIKDKELSTSNDVVVNKKQPDEACSNNRSRRKGLQGASKGYKCPSNLLSRAHRQLFARLHLTSFLSVMRTCMCSIACLLEGMDCV